MIVGIDTNCILPGQVGGIENYTVESLIEAAKLPGFAGIANLFLLTRPENHEMFEAMVADQRTTTVLLKRPEHKGKPVKKLGEAAGETSRGWPPHTGGISKAKERAAASDERGIWCISRETPSIRWIWICRSC